MRRVHYQASWLACIAIAAIVLAGVFAAACGGDDDGDDENGTGDITPIAQSSPTEGAEEPTEEADGTPTPTPTEDGEPSPGGESATVRVAQDPELGAILVDSRGFTLYTFGNDTPGSGTSICVDGCAQAWPPLSADGEPTGGDGVDGDLATIQREDGTVQVTYNGAPLYRYVSDTAPGQTNGHMQGNIWFVATP